MNKSKTTTAKTPVELAQALGLSGAESEEWKVQYSLLKQLRRIVLEKALTHAEIAKLGGSSRTRVTSILNGKLNGVSSDLLIRLLRGLGYRVKVTVAQLKSAA